MNYFFAIDWEDLFRPRMSVLEVLIRGTCIYVALCVLLRVVLKRQAGKVSMTDLLVVSLVAGVCRNPLMRDAYSVTDGLSMVVVVLGWGYALDWLSYRVPAIHNLLHPEPVVLIEGGEIRHENLRRELVTESQLLCQLRQQGVSSPSEVAEALLEGSGKISVLREKGKPAPPRPEANGHARNGMPHPPAETDGFSPPPNHHDPDVDEFLHAADRLRERIAGHERRIAEHRAAVAELKGMLAEHGVRWKAHETKSLRGPRG
jgi:uncharacterized membrane protein YcaP (DUF421 family)